MISSILNQYRNPISHDIPFILSPPVSLPDDDKEMQKQVKKKVRAMSKSKDKVEAWMPSDSLEASLNSLSIFLDFKDEDGKKMAKKEIKESYDNLDNWIDEQVARYAQIEKIKENKAIDV